MQQLSRPERLQLMRFVCTFAWADLEVTDAERAFVGGLIRRLQLPPDEVELVEGWLKVPPTPDEVDPTDVPRAHRELLLDAIRRLIEVDGEVHEEERDNLRLLEQLLR
jgi:uncharacterized tellurite resistance protein B-like protein